MADFGLAVSALLRMVGGEVSLTNRSECGTQIPGRVPQVFWIVCIHDHFQKHPQGPPFSLFWTQ